MKSYKGLIIFLALAIHHTAYAAYEGGPFGFIIFGGALLFMILSFLGLSWVINFLLFTFFKKTVRIRTIFFGLICCLALPPIFFGLLYSLGVI